MTTESLLWLLQFIVLPMLFSAVGLTLVRLVRGPSLSDRVVAIDMLGTLGIGLVAVYAALFQTRLLLDVATVIALLSFIGTVAFAYYIERRAV